MKRMNLPLMSKWLASAALLVGSLTASALAQSPNHGIAEPAQGQNPPPVRVGGVVITGIPEDWSDHHIVFSDPGTEQEAIWNGRHAEWQRIVNNPRYVIQQMRKNRPVRGPAAADAEARSKSTAAVATPLNEGAWAVSLNGPGLAAGHYPAKYGLSTTAAADCRDFVVFPTGAPGSGGGTTPTAGQATIVAFYNLYVGGCNTPNPVAYWAYNTGGTASLSPVLSLDGEQVAYVQTVSGAPQLVLLKTAACSNCSVQLPITPTHETSAAAYRTCLAPCYYQIGIGGTDANEAPFYRYDNDTLYATNDQGQVAVVSPAFNGIPAQPFGPLNLNAQPVSSPVYDFASGLLFVKTAAGTIESVFARANPPSAIPSSQLECNGQGSRDAPTVDSSLGLLYAFIGYGCDATHDSFINRFVTSTFASASPGPGTGTAFNFGNGTNNPSTTVGTHGAFDISYLTGGSGNLYSCVNGIVYRLPNPAGGSSVVAMFATLTGSNTPNSTAVCSPVTSFQDASGVDRLFVSVQANGSASGCSGSCVFSITLPGGALAGATATGGTSGIIVDTSSTHIAGTQQLYFTTRSSPSSATQLSQSGLH